MSAGFGIAKIMFGQKFIRNTENDGSMLMLARPPSISLFFIMRVSSLLVLAVTVCVINVFGDRLG